MPKEEQIVIRLKPNEKIVSEKFHDRYIQTNQLTVGFSKGFDLSNHNQKCSPCDVYRFRNSNKTLDTLINSRDAGYFVW